MIQEELLGGIMISAICYPVAYADIGSDMIASYFVDVSGKFISFTAGRAFVSRLRPFVRF